MDSLPIAALVFLVPMLGGAIAAYRIGASPRIAIVLAIVMISSLVLSLRGSGSAWGYVFGPLFLFTLSWGVTGKLIWEAPLRGRKSELRADDQQRGG